MFDIAYANTRKFEGGYSNHKNDRGGATINGISSKYWPQDFATVKALVDQGRTKEAEDYTKNFYKTNFWEPSGAEQAPQEMQPLIFDAAVNHGVGTAKKMLASSSSPDQFLNQRQDYMNNIVKNDPSQAVFQKGWNNRVQAQKTSDELTPQEQAELAQLEAEFEAPQEAPLSPEEQAELAQLEAETQQPKEKGILERGANIASAGADAYTWGLGPKIGAAVGAGGAKLALEGLEKVQGATNAMGLTNKPFTSPSYKDLYKSGVDMYSRGGKEAFKDDPALAITASLAGGLKSGTQLAKTQLGKTVGNSLRNSNSIPRVAKSAGLGAISGGIYGAGSADVGKELEGGASGALTGAAFGAAAPVAGKVIGGAVKGSGNLIKGATARGEQALADSLDNISQKSSSAYTKMRQLGADFTPQASQRIATKLEQTLASDGPLNAKLHDKVLAAIDDIKTRGFSSLEELDQWRQVLNDVAGNFSDKVNARKAKLLINAIDDEIENIGQKDLANGSREAVDALLEGRMEWARRARFQKVSDIIKNAAGDANKLKRDLDKLRTDPRKTKGWSKEELSALNDAAKQTTGEGVLKILGKFGFDLGSGRAVGNTALPAMGSLAAGAGTMSLGPAAAVPIVGTMARQGQKAVARGKAEKLLEAIEKGSSAPKAISKQKQQLINALTGANKISGSNPRLQAAILSGQLQNK